MKELGGKRLSSQSFTGLVTGIKIMMYFQISRRQTSCLLHAQFSLTSKNADLIKRPCAICHPQEFTGTCGRRSFTQTVEQHSHVVNKDYFYFFVNFLSSWAIRFRKSEMYGIKYFFSFKEEINDLFLLIAIDTSMKKGREYMSKVLRDG